MSINGIDITGKFVIIDKDMVIPSFASDNPRDMLFLAQSGFGCEPDKLGTKVYGVWVKDGTEDQIRRGMVARLAAEDEIEHAQTILTDRAKTQTLQGLAAFNNV